MSELLLTIIAITLLVVSFQLYEIRSQLKEKLPILDILRDSYQLIKDRVKSIEKDVQKLDQKQD